MYFKEFEEFGGEGGLGIGGNGLDFRLTSSLLMVSSFVLFSTLYYSTIQTLLIHSH